MNNDLQNIIIRQENTADYKEIDGITDKAFGDSGEAVVELVNLIRESPNYIQALSLVAEKQGKTVGHIMLSHLNLDDNGIVHKVVTLSPISVEPTMQNIGIGTLLIKTAIKNADESGETLIMLEGNPSYYSRFGFKPGKEFGISIALPHWAPEAAMVLPLSHYSEKIKGKIIYPPYFDKVNEAPHIPKKSQT